MRMPLRIPGRRMPITLAPDRLSGMESAALSPPENRPDAAAGADACAAETADTRPASTIRQDPSLGAQSLDFRRATRRHWWWQTEVTPILDQNKGRALCASVEAGESQAGPQRYGLAIPCVPVASF